MLSQITLKKPDLVEFRLDKLDNLGTIETIGRKKTMPKIATCRTPNNSESRKKLLSAANSGFEYVDIDSSTSEAKELAETCKNSGAKVIASAHNFQKTPPLTELNKEFDSMSELEPNLYKIVTTATHRNDNLEILNFVKEKCPEAKLVSFAMGSLGVPSRILSPVFGAEFTLAALTQDSKTADGQPTIDDLRSVWQLLGIQ